MYNTAPFTINAMAVVCLVLFTVVTYEIHPVLPFAWAAWRVYDDRG